MTGSALRAVRLPNLHITPDARRDLVYAASATGAGAKKLGLDTITLLASNPAELDSAFERLLSVKADAIVIGTDPIMFDRRVQIAGFKATVASSAAIRLIN